MREKWILRMRANERFKYTAAILDLNQCSCASHVERMLNDVFVHKHIQSAGFMDCGVILPGVYGFPAFLVQNSGEIKTKV